MRGSSVSGIPTPVSLTVSDTFAASRRIATSIRPWKVNLNALERRLRRIFSHIPIDIDRLADRRAVDHEPQTSPLTSRTKVRRDFSRQSGKIDRLVSRLNSPRLNARGGEQRVGQSPQTAGSSGFRLQEAAIMRKEP